MKKNIAAGILVVIGIALALYVGLWLMFVGGIIGLINVIKAVETPAGLVALNVIKIFFASVVGWLIFYLFVGMAALVKGKKWPSKHK